MPSVAVAMQVMIAPTLELLAVRVSVAPVPSEALFSSCHAKLGVRLPSSASVASAVHVRVSPTAGLLGEMEAPVLKIGSVFSMVTDAVLSAVSPCASVAVAEQTMESPTSVSEAETV